MTEQSWDKDAGHFFILNNSLRDGGYLSRMSGSAAKVYLALKIRAGKKEHCWPSYRTLADDTGLSHRTVITAVAELKELAMVSVTKRTVAGSDTNAQDSNSYVLLPLRMPDEAETESHSVVQKTASPPVQETASPVVQNATPRVMQKMTPPPVQKTAPKEYEPEEDEVEEDKEPTVLTSPRIAPTQQSMVGAILRVFGLAMTNERERGKITKAAKLLLESGATEEELVRRVANYRRKWPQIDCTPLAMASHWAEMEHVEPVEPMRRVTYKEQAAINGRTNLESVVAAIKEREHGRGHVQVGDGQAARGVPPRDVGDVPRVVGRVVGIPARV